jgi:hypothetical protein
MKSEPGPAMMLATRLRPEWLIIWYTACQHQAGRDAAEIAASSAGGPIKPRQREGDIKTL